MLTLNHNHFSPTLTYRHKSDIRTTLSVGPYWRISSFISVRADINLAMKLLKSNTVKELLIDRSPGDKMDYTPLLSTHGTPDNIPIEIIHGHPRIDNNRLGGYSG